MLNLSALKNRILLMGAIVLTPFFIFIILNFVFPLNTYKLEKDYSTLYLDREGRILRITLSPSGKYRIKYDLSDISDILKEYIILYEDKYFYFHPGVNPFSVFRAFVFNMRSSEIKIGASTISMQIARMMKRRERTYASKLIEVFRAFQIELRYSKDEILSLYLNMIPMGGNIEGVGAASYFYFEKSPKRLSEAQALILTGIPKNPNQNRIDSHFGRAKEISKNVLKRIAGANAFKDASKVFKNVKDLYPRKKNPYIAPHLINRLKKKEGPFIRRLSLDYNTQLFASDVLSFYSKKYSKERIYNGAIIVLDNKKKEVLAYIGSADFYDSKHAGQVNGANISRSPGSALKPFIYARALEEGMITPLKRVVDIEKEYRGYSPRNFSRSSYGLIRAKRALIYSLNTPAVRLENALSKKGLASILRSVYPLSKEEEINAAGLSVALGGFQLTLEKVAALYMALARFGVYSDFSFYLGEGENNASKRILSEAAAYITSEMLSDYYRPDLPFSWEYTKDLARVALKTGTSFGLRDAWCIGYNAEYTVAVWIGNASSKGAQGLLGIEKAGPVFIDVFNYLSRGKHAWFKRPKSVGLRKVCSLSGEVLSDVCSNEETDYYIKGVSSQKPCSIHKEIYVHKEKGFAVCPYCMDESSDSYEKRVYEKYSKEVSTFYKERGIARPFVPKHNPLCNFYYKESAPEIISPKNNGTYYIVYEEENECAIELKANVHADVDTLYWFSSKELLKKTSSKEKVFAFFQEGVHRVSCVDEAGRSSEVTIQVLKE